MIIGYNVNPEPTVPVFISQEKLRLKSTLDRICRRAYIFLILLTSCALGALLVTTFSGYRIVRVFSPSRSEAANALIELQSATRDLESAMPANAEALSQTLDHLERARTNALNVIDLGFQSSGLFSAALPNEAAEEAQQLIAGLDLLKSQLGAVGDAKQLARLPDKEQASLRDSLASLVTRAGNIQLMLAGQIEFESMLFRMSGILAAAGILLLAVFAAAWFHRFDRLRSVQFNSSVLAEQDLRQREASLKDRVNELNCLYRFSKIIESGNRPLDKLATDIVNSIPTGWKHSNDAWARLIVGERSYASQNFRETQWKQVEPLKLNNQEVGSLQVGYLSPHPELSEGPFTIEERALLKALAEQIDLLLHKYQLRDQVQASRKFEGIGALISGICHDFNNILFAIMGNAEMALSTTTNLDPVYHKVKNIVQATNRARDLTKQLLSCTKPAKDEPDSIPVNRVVEEVLKLVRASLPSTIKLDIKFYKPQTYVFAQFTEVHQIMLNLCSNAGYAMRDSGGTLRVSVEELELRRSSFRPGGVINSDRVLSAFPHLQQGSYVRISVRDTGCGIQEKLLPRIFEPFFSTKPSEDGTGMGLFNVREIVNRLNGAVLCESWPGEGSLFEVYLPSAPPSVASEQLNDQVPRGSERILLVDDEQVIVSMLDGMLSELGYIVTTFTDSRRALQDFAVNPDAYDLLLTDLTMPDMTGIKLIDHICSIKPGLPAIMMSGNDAPPDNGSGSHFPYFYLKKPIAKHNMAQMIREALGNSPASKRQQLRAV